MVSRRTVWQLVVLVVDLLVDSVVDSLEYMFHLIDLSHHVIRPFLTLFI